MLSIIIPTLNEEKHIAYILDQLLKQDFSEDLEIIIADAHSQDKTREVARKYQDKFSKLSIIDGGLPAVGRNQGAKISLGDPIMFLDADLSLPDSFFLKNSVNYFRNKNLSIATTFLEPRSDKLTDRFLIISYNFIMRLFKFTKTLGSACVIVKRDVFQKSGGYPEDVLLAEDHAFVRSCAHHGRYDILPYKVAFSVRRFNKEGRFILLLKYFKILLHMIFLGPVKKPIVKYEFKYSDKEDAGE